MMSNLHVDAQGVYLVFAPTKYLFYFPLTWYAKIQGTTFEALPARGLLSQSLVTGPGKTWEILKNDFKMFTFQCTKCLQNVQLI